MYEQNNNNNNETNEHIFTINNHEIKICKNTDNIELHICNNKIYTQYHRYIMCSDLTECKTLACLYKLILNCLNKKDNYNYSLNIHNKNIQLIFTANFDNIMNINEKIIVLPIEISTDEIVTKKINELEIKLKTKDSEIVKLNNKTIEFKNTIIDLKERIEKLETKPIMYLYRPNVYNKIIQLYKSDTEFDCVLYQNYILEQSQIIYLNEMTNLKKIKSFSLFGDNDQFCQSLLGRLNEKIYIPSVSELHIYYKGGEFINSNVQFKSLPNLEKIIFQNWQTSVLSPYAFLKTIEFLKNVTFVNCISITELDQIKTWCESKNIAIVIK